MDTPSVFGPHSFRVGARKSSRRRIVIVSDASPEQTNGVVRTNHETIERLIAQGHDARLFTVDRTRFHFGAPGYPEIRLQFFQDKRLARELDGFAPHNIHIATEGPLGLAARAYCLKRGRAFTTAFHTNFDRYMAPRVEAIFRACYLPKALCRSLGRLTGSLAAGYLRWFHKPSGAVMVATQALKKELEAMGYRRLVDWSRGVDTDMFKPCGKDIPVYADMPRPIYIVHGRVAIEKSLEDFLSLDLPGSKVVIGDGPALEALERQFPDAHFTGMLEGEVLARHLSAADIFVMPSRSETFGLVLLEALACGLPVAGYDVPISREILGGEGQRFTRLNGDLGQAVRDVTERLGANGFDADGARDFVAMHYGWDAATRQFFANLRAQTMPGKYSAVMRGLRRALKEERRLRKVS